MSEQSYELKFLEAAASELKSYLLSDEIYWNLGVRAPGGDRPYPQFSLGWLLVFRRRLAADRSTPALTVMQAIAETEDQWKSAWGRKAAKEFEQRLKLWAAFLNEVRQSPASNRDRYPYEVQRRTMLELLQQDAGELPDQQVKLLRTMDVALRAMLKDSPFIEDRSFEGQFPRDRFWFLYGEIK